MSDPNWIYCDSRGVYEVDVEGETCDLDDGDASDADLYWRDTVIAVVAAYAIVCSIGLMALLAS